MKKLILCSLFFLPVMGGAQPRNPKPTSPDAIYRNDLDVWDDINARITRNGNLICIDVLCVDIVTHRVGIGTTTPAGKLQIFSAQDEAALMIRDTELNINWTLYPRNDDRLALFRSNLSTDVWTVSSVGEITQPLQPSFLVQSSIAETDVTGDGDVWPKSWEVEVFDQGGDFASSAFTAPVSGRYVFTAFLSLGQVATTHTNRRLRIVTSNRTYQTVENSALAYTRLPLSLSVIADMDANDTAYVDVIVEDSTQTVDILDDLNSFSGSLLN